MATLIPFPNLFGHATEHYDPQTVADFVADAERRGVFAATGAPCRNGMPGHPECRSPAELERLLRAAADVTADRSES